MKRCFAVLCLSVALLSVPAASMPLATAQPVLCESGADLAATLFAAPVEAATCPNIRCSSHAECAQACPAARTALCSTTTRGCVYTFPGGGGGGGNCPSTRCIEDTECVCNGRPGVCIERACQY